MAGWGCVGGEVQQEMVTSRVGFAGRVFYLAGWQGRQRQKYQLATPLDTTVVECKTVFCLKLATCLASMGHHRAFL
jgi:hypothetical protein